MKFFANYMLKTGPNYFKIKIKLNNCTTIDYIKNDYKQFTYEV